MESMVKLSINPEGVVLGKSKEIPFIVALVSRLFKDLSDMTHMFFHVDVGEAM